jgi:4-carboxymuconolactone decarboxylase
VTVAARPASPRIRPLPAARVLADLGLPATNLFATLVRHPRLLCRWVPFGQRLLSGSLPARDRELLILRTGWRCGAEYEWGQHALLARAVGLTRDEITRVSEGPDAAEWDPFEATLLRAADELHDGASITDTTWTTLAGRYDERQMIELLMLVGQYHIVAFTLNSIGVQRERGVPGFGPDAPG